MELLIISKPIIMSEELYFITAKTKGENPVVLFLNGNIAWSKYAMLNPLVENLHDCYMCAESEPTHCLFVEAIDSLCKELKDIMNSEKDFVTPAELKQLIEKHNCHTVSTKQKKEKPAKEDVRKYVLYRDGLVVFGQFYYSCCGGETRNKNKACLMTLAEAEAKQKELENKGKFLWQLKKQHAKTEQRQTTQDAPIEQPQKRVGYVLVENHSDGEKIYRCESDVYVIIGNKAADVFMTKEQADFTCYTIHLICQRGDVHSTPWKVEQIEF